MSTTSELTLNVISADSNYDTVPAINRQFEVISSDTVTSQQRIILGSSSVALNLPSSLSAPQPSSQVILMNRSSTYSCICSAAYYSYASPVGGGADTTATFPLQPGAILVLPSAAFLHTITLSTWVNPPTTVVDPGTQATLQPCSSANTAVIDVIFI